jgi:hypothetical protein
LLADKFTDVFKNTFADAIADFASGTKSLKDTINDLGKSLVSQLNKIAAQNLSEQLFGKGGPLGGLGKFFSDAFSKGGTLFGGGIKPGGNGGGIFPEGATPAAGLGFGMNDRSNGGIAWRSGCRWCRRSRHGANYARRSSAAADAAMSTLAVSSSGN